MSFQQYFCLLKTGFNMWNKNFSKTLSCLHQIKIFILFTLFQPCDTHIHIHTYIYTLLLLFSFNLFCFWFWTNFFSLSHSLCHTYGTSLVHFAGFVCLWGNDSPGERIIGCFVVVVVVYFVVRYSDCMVRKQKHKNISDKIVFIRKLRKFFIILLWIRIVSVIFTAQSNFQMLVV